MSNPLFPKPTAADADQLLVDQFRAARALCVCTRTLVKLPIPRIKVGKSVRYRVSDLKAYVEGLQGQGGGGGQ